MDKFYSIFGKIVVILLVVGLIGGTAFYFGQKSNVKDDKTPAPTKEVEKLSVENTMPVIGEENVEEQIVEKNEKGIIKGTLGYPSEGIPPLEIYAISSTDDSKYFFIKTAQNQNSFEIEDVDPGTYYVLAYAESNFAGGWTKAVPCGLTVDCNDHSLIEVEVKAGKTASGIEVKDWYAPENTFPSRPN